MTKTKKPTKPVKEPAAAKKPPVVAQPVKKQGKRGPKPRNTVKKVEGEMNDPNKLNLTPFKDIIEGEVKMGRPTKMTEKVIWQLYEALRLGVPVNKACKWLKIAPKTYYSWKEKNADFRNTMNEAENFASRLCRLAVLKQVKAGDGKLALKYLSLKENAEFNSRMIVEEDDHEDEPTGILTAEEIEQVKLVLGDDYELLDDEDDE